MLYQSKKDEEVTPRAGVVYKPADNVSLYASYSETFMPATGEQFKKAADKVVKMTIAKALKESVNN